MADYHYQSQSKKPKIENDEPSSTLIINQVWIIYRSDEKKRENMKKKSIKNGKKIRKKGKNEKKNAKKAGKNNKKMGKKTCKMKKKQ